MPGCWSGVWVSSVGQSWEFDLHLGPECDIGRGACVCGNLGGSHQCEDTEFEGHPLLSCVRLCWQAASLHQLCTFISALHAGPWSREAYHKGHIFNTAFNPTILRI